VLISGHYTFKFFLKFIHGQKELHSSISSSVAYFCSSTSPNSE